MELTQENFDKLMKKVSSLEEETTNKTKALDAEREKRKTYEATLSEHEQKERAKREERLKKDGKMEQLLEDYQGKIKNLEEKISQLEPVANEYSQFKQQEQTKIVTELESLKSSLNPRILERYSDVISGLDAQQQMTILQQVAEDVKTPDFGSKPESKGTVETTGFNAVTPTAYSKLNREQRREYESKSMDTHGRVVMASEE